jgi:hypothetical protein
MVFVLKSINLLMKQTKYWLIKLCIYYQEITVFVYDYFGRLLYNIMKLFTITTLVSLALSLPFLQ